MHKVTSGFHSAEQNYFEIIPQSAIKQLPGLFVIVDLNSRFIAANPNALRWAGFKSLDDMVGSSYVDMRCRAASQHADFSNQDKAVIANNLPVKVLGRYCYSGDDWKILFGEKYLIKDENEKPKGVILQFHDITNYHIVDFYRFLRLGESNPSSKVYEQQVSYILEESYPKINLTGRQTECLFFMLRGKTIKAIAEILDISPRTVEAYLEEIKNKLNCSTKSELIEKSISLGYMNIIPKKILDKIKGCDFAQK